MDCAGRERDATAAHLLDCAGAFDFNARRAAIFDNHAVRVDAGTNREIQTMARGREIADGGRDADAVAPVARPWADAGGLGIVMVQDFGVSSRARGVEKGVIERLPVLRTRTLDPDRSAESVKIAARIAIVFELAMERKDLLEAPLAIAPGRPFVEITGRAAQRDMTVDGRTATGNLAARVCDFPARRGICDQTPVVRSRRDPCVQQVGRSVLDG